MRIIAVARIGPAASDAARHRALLSLRAALPRVGVLDQGVYACDLRGTARLLGPPQRVAARIVSVCARAEAACAVGVGPGPFIARVVAARTPLGETRELTGSPREFLAPLPVTTLPIDPRVAEELSLMGIRDVGSFAALGHGAVLDRFGRAAAAAQLLACGIDDVPVHGVAPVRRIRAGRRFEDAIGSKEQLIFALRTLADQIAARLTLDGLAALRLVLDTERDGLRPLRLERVLLPPVADPVAIVRSLRWALDERAEIGAIDAVSIEVLEVEPLRGRQLGLFAPDGAHTEEATAVAQHLRDRLGPGTVLRARVQAPAARLPEREAAWSEVVG